MARFEIQTPEGRFEVEAPDEATALKALGVAGAPEPAMDPARMEDAHAPGGEAGAEVIMDMARRRGGPDLDSLPNALHSKRVAYQEDAGTRLRPMEFIDSAVRRVANTASFGLANRADPQPEQDARFQELHPVVGMAADVGGSIAGLAPVAATRLGASALGITGRNLGTRAAKGAVSGAGIGAGSAAIQGGDPLSGAVPGAALGLAAPILGRAAGSVVASRANRAARREVPDADELLERSDAAYDAADAAGVAIKPAALAGLAADVRSHVRSAGFDPRMHTKVATALQLIDEAAAGPQTLRQMDTLRQIVRDVGATPGEGRLSKVIVQRMDEFLSDLKPTAVIAGNPEAGVKALVEARSLWRTGKKGEVIANMLERAQNSASGLEIGLRNQFRSLAGNPKRMKDFTAEEQAAILRIVRGGKGEHIMQFVGKFAPRGLVSSMLTGTLGGAVGGPAGIAAALSIGDAAKRVSTRMTSGNAEKLDALVRSGGRVPMVPGAGMGVDQGITRLLATGGVPLLPEYSRAPVRGR